MKKKPKNNSSFVLPILFGTFVIVIGAILATQFGSLLTGSAFKPPGNIFTVSPSPKAPGPTLTGPPTTTPAIGCILHPTKELKLIDFEIAQLFAQQEVISNRLYNSGITYSADERRVLEKLIHEFNKKIEDLQRQKEAKRGDSLPKCAPTGPSIAL